MAAVTLTRRLVPGSCVWLLAWSLGATALSTMPGIASGRTIRVDALSEAKVSSGLDAGWSPERGTLPAAPQCASTLVDSVRCELCLPGSIFTFGDTVRMEYTITNEGSSEVALHLPGFAGPGTVSIHAADGRRIKSWNLRPQTKLALRWNGRDERGHLVPAGVYFVGVSHGERLVARATLLLVR